MLLRFALSLLPVLLFLALLYGQDGYKLLSLRRLLFTIGAGVLAALVAFWATEHLVPLLPLSRYAYSAGDAPLLEEALKAAWPVALLLRRKIGFAGDAVIYGFAAGTGFALVENIYYALVLESGSVTVWLIRGLGTAVMHGGTTSVLTLLLTHFSEREGRFHPWQFMVAFILAVSIHSMFNLFLLSPVIETMLQLVLLPALMFWAFRLSEKDLRDWLDKGFDSDIALLDAIETGQILETRAGRYLYSLNDRYPLELVADMFVTLQTHLELAVRAKGVLLLRDTGYDPGKDPELKEKFQDLEALEKSIGPLGRRLLAPLLRHDRKELWQLYFLKEDQAG